MIRTPSYTTKVPGASLALWCRRMAIGRTVLAAVIAGVISTSCASEGGAPLFFSDSDVNNTTTERKFSGYIAADSAQGEPDTGSLSDCFDQETVFDLAVTNADPRFEDIDRYSLTKAQLFFGFAYQGAGSCEAINLLSIPSIGSLETPLVIDPFQTDVCTTATDPVVLDTAAGWMTIWSQNSDTGGGLFLREPGIDNPSTPIAQTQNYLKSLTATRDEQDAVVVAWISGDDDTREIQGKRLGPSGDAITIISDPERYPEKIALHRLYESFALVWLDMSDANKGLYLALLDDNLSLLGPIILVTPYVSAQSTFDLLTDIYGHVILYSTALGTNREIRLRRFNEFGEWISKERYIVAKPEYARDGSLDAYGTLGQVVVYRSSPDAMSDDWTIRMAFVTNDGRRVGDTYVAATAVPDGGRVTVRTSADGTIAVAWMDATAYEKRLRVIRIRMGCSG